jgi:hypothetical protein
MGNTIRSILYRYCCSNFLVGRPIVLFLRDQLRVPNTLAVIITLIFLFLLSVERFSIISNQSRRKHSQNWHRRGHKQSRSS